MKVLRQVFNLNSLYTSECIYRGLNIDPNHYALKGMVQHNIHGQFEKVAKLIKHLK